MKSTLTSLQSMAIPLQDKVEGSTFYLRSTSGCINSCLGGFDKLVKNGGEQSFAGGKFWAGGRAEGLVVQSLTRGTENLICQYLMGRTQMGKSCTWKDTFSFIV